MRNKQTNSWILSALVLVVFGLVALPETGGGQEVERLSVSGGDVSIYNLAGTVEVLPGSGSSVEVEISKGGDDAGMLEVDVREVNGRQALIIRYPSDEVVYPEMGRRSNTNLRVRDDGTFGGGWGSRGDQVDIRGSGNGMEAWADLVIRVPDGSDLAVHLAVGEASVGAVEGDIRVDTGSGAVRARGGSGSLNLDTGSGSVTVLDFQGDLLVDTGSGAVEISGIRGGEVDVDTGSGSVRGDGVAASHFGVDTGSGQIILNGVSAPEISLDTGSGSVELELLEDVDEVVIDTGSGGVTIRVPSSLGAEIEVDTGSGGIDLDIPVEVRTIKRNYMRGVLGDGRGSISVDTGSGAIRLIGG